MRKAGKPASALVGAILVALAFIGPPAYAVIRRMPVDPTEHGSGWRCAFVGPAGIGVGGNPCKPVLRLK